MSKNISGNKQYEGIRNLLSHIYLYGFFSRMDFEEANIIKVKSYDQVLRLIYDIFPKDEQNAIFRERRKYPRLERLYTESGKYVTVKPSTSREAWDNSSRTIRNVPERSATVFEEELI